MSDAGSNRSDLTPGGAAWRAGFAEAIHRRLGVDTGGRCGTCRRIRQLMNAALSALRDPGYTVRQLGACLLSGNRDQRTGARR